MLHLLHARMIDVQRNARQVWSKADLPNELSDIAGA